MQFRTVRTTYKGVTRQYGQIVESFRKPDTKVPTHRVLFSLGPVDDVQAANFRAAFAAARDGRRLHVVGPDVLANCMPTVAWSRDFADVAAVLQAFDDSGLFRLVRDLFAGHGEDLNPADVVAALVAQRCIAPDSKLAACRWVPDTVLPDLLGILPGQFHNTRIHRVLARLEAADADLQAGLAGRLLAVDGRPCTAFFIDCTDTWFSGDGPDLARRGKTKEGLIRFKVGIVLLCRQDGMPLAFKVVAGNTDDGIAMLGLLRDVVAEPWLAGAPVVCDRALGNTSDLLAFIDMGLPFVTALVRSEHAAYGAVVDCPALADLDPSDPDCLAKAGDAVVAAGMTRDGADLYWSCRPAVRRGQADRDAVQAALGSRTTPAHRRGDDLVRDMLLVARKYQQAVREGKVANYAALQRGIGRSNGHMHRHRSLLRLPGHVQDQILAGAARNLDRRAIGRICAGKDAAEQAELFATECAHATVKRAHNLQGRRPPSDEGNPWVTVVVAFNPRLWQSKRLRAGRLAERAQQLISRLNGRVATRALAIGTATKKVDQWLERHELTRYYSAVQTTGAAGVATVRLERDAQAWHRARQRDGFHVVVGSPELALSPAELVRLYRSKDQVEKDFQEIKSVIDLRPVRHRTDAKVRAHVALCVLALAVERTIEAKLAQAGRSETAKAALAALRSVRLTGLCHPGHDEVVAAPCVGTPEQRALAKALGVSWVFDAAGCRERVGKIGR